MAYAENGFYVLPVRPPTESGDNGERAHNGKNPGSLVGKRWQTQSTCDPGVVRAWWDRWPDANIALHTGPSGVVALDVDRPDKLPTEFKDAIKVAKTPWQKTRADTKGRGHYVFRAPADPPIGNSKHPWGEVRGASNGVIILDPSTHALADNGGQYRWKRVGELPELPELIKAQLNPATATEVPATPDEVEAFLNTYTTNDRPNLLNVGPLAKYRRDIEEESASRHATMVEVACWAFREVICGAYPARTAYDALAGAWGASFRPPDMAEDGGSGRHRSPDPGEFSRIVSWALAQALGDPERLERQRERVYRPIGQSSDGDGAKSSPFVRVSARELADPVPPMRWLIRDVWMLNSFGPLGGKKKTLKTYNLGAMALAVASGKPMFGHFAVDNPGPVVLYIAEGGREPFTRRMQRISDAYGIDLRDLPLRIVFGMAPLNSKLFLSELQRDLDEMQPVLYGLDPLYAYHPPEMSAENLYVRGPMLQQFRAEVGEDLSLIIPDHFNKSSNGKELDLDDIGYAGWSAVADSWMLQRHRADPNLATGEFKLETVFASRHWGGSQYAVDWTIPAPVGDLSGGGSATHADATRITWTVTPSDSTATAERKSTATRDKAERRAMETARDHPFEMTKTKLAEAIGGNRSTALDAIENLLGTGYLVERPVARLEGKATRTRPLIGPGDEPGRVRVGTS